MPTFRVNPDLVAASGGTVTEFSQINAFAAEHPDIMAALKAKWDASNARDDGRFASIGPAVRIGAQALLTAAGAGAAVKVLQLSRPDSNLRPPDLTVIKKNRTSACPWAPIGA